MTADDRMQTGITKNTKILIVLMTVLLTVAVIGGTFWIFRIADQERQRDLRAWQIRMGLVASSRASDIGRWVADILEIPRSLAANESVQLYMTVATEIAEEGEPVTDQGAAAEVEYLRNLIQVTALRAGFIGRTDRGQIGSNVRIVGAGGIAVTDAKGRVLAATQGMPAVNEHIQQAMERARRGEFILVDMHQNPQGDPVVGFVGPIHGIQQDQSTTEPVGFVFGVKRVDADLWARLIQPGEATRTGENILVRAVGADGDSRGRIEYLSPMVDDVRPMALQMDAKDSELAAAFALRYPGEFAERVDYRSAPVLVTSRPVRGTSWVVVRKVAVEEALGPTDERLFNLRLILGLLIVGVAVTIIAVWRHGTSVRLATVAHDLRQVSDQLSYRTAFLGTVTDAQPTFIGVMDRDGVISFANRQSATTWDIPKDELIGKTLASAIGRAQAADFERLNRQVFITGEPASEVIIFDRNEGRQHLKATHIPMDRDDKGETRTVLMIVEDVSEIMQAQEKQQRMLRDLVHVLVGLVDQRDPYSANHSARVAEVAVAIAQEMGQPNDVEMTVDIAGNLMNLGKIFVPQSILAKTDALSDEEFATVRDSILRSADLLDGVRFDLPVVDVIRQLQERWDGTGYPLGLDGAKISVGARIVCVANALVAMVSPRAFRDAMEFSTALKQLMADAEVKFDMAAVSALANVLENRGGAAKWAHFRRIPTDTDIQD